VLSCVSNSFGSPNPKLRFLIFLIFLFINFVYMELSRADEYTDESAPPSVHLFFFLISLFIAKSIQRPNYSLST
jgi:hypothetical protein